MADQMTAVTDARGVVDALHKALRTSLEQLASARPGGFEEVLSRLDMALRACSKDADGLRRYLVLHRAPVYSRVDPLTLLRQHAPHRVRLSDPLAPDEPIWVQADAEQVIESIRAIWQATAVGSAETTTRLYVNDEQVTIEISIESPPPTIPFASTLALTHDRFAGSWAAATDGGAFCASDHGFRFEMIGESLIPRFPETLGRALEPVQALARALAPWRGAAGGYEEGIVSPIDALRTYGETVRRAIKYVEIAASTLMDDAT